MFGELFDEVRSDISGALDGDSGAITFVCTPDFVPYQVVQYLEALGVRAKPRAHVHIAEDGTRTSGVTATWCRRLLRRTSKSASTKGER